jgi:transcriptional regulator GlxA family with amidase domain
MPPIITLTLRPSAAKIQAIMEARPAPPLDETTLLAAFASAETMTHRFRQRMKTSPQAWRRRFAGESERTAVRQP